MNIFETARRADAAYQAGTVLANKSGRTAADTTKAATKFRVAEKLNKLLVEEYERQGLGSSAYAQGAREKHVLARRRRSAL